MTGILRIKYRIYRTQVITPASKLENMQRSSKAPRERFWECSEHCHTSYTICRLQWCRKNCTKSNAP